MNEQVELFNELPPTKRAGRGPGKKPAMVSTSIRLPKDILEFFDAHYPNSKQAKIRQVLTDYVTGLADGRLGFYSKVHHAAVDGQAAVAMANSVYEDILEFFDAHYPNSKQAKIRQVLTDYVTDSVANP